MKTFFSLGQAYLKSSLLSYSSVGESEKPRLAGRSKTQDEFWFWIPDRLVLVCSPIKAFEDKIKRGTLGNDKTSPLFDLVLRAGFFVFNKI